MSPEELAKAKKQKLADYVFERQTVEQQAHGLGLDMLSTYDPNFSEAYVRNIQQVTAEDIREVARLYFREETLVQAVVRPKSDTPSALAPTPVAHREPVVKKVLANGMTLLLKRNPALPTVAMQAYFKGGTCRNARHQRTVTTHCQPVAERHDQSQCRGDCGNF